MEYADGKVKDLQIAYIGGGMDIYDGSGHG
mgnify:CR=1 FL=1